MAFNKEKFECGECEICSVKFKGRSGLARHVKWLHKINLEEYFLMFGGIKVNCECGKPSNWLGTNMRFSGYCSKKCSQTITRRNRKDDAVYRENISKAMVKVWASRPPSEATVARRERDRIVKLNTKKIYSSDLTLPPIVEESLSIFFGMKYERQI